MRYATLITPATKADVCITDFQTDTAAASTIFTGRVINVMEGNFWIGTGPHTIYNFEVKQSFKGLPDYYSIISVIAPYPGCCGHFMKDSSYLVFAYRSNASGTFYHTDDCSMTEPLSSPVAAKFIALLGKPVIHKSPESWQFVLMKDNLEILQADSLRQDMEQLKLENSNREWHYELGIMGLLALLTATVYGWMSSRKR